MASSKPSKSVEPPKRKPSGKKAEKLSQKEQSERFAAAAKELGADESGEAFERAVSIVIPRKPHPG